MQQFGFREDTSTDLLLCALYHREFVLKEINAPGEEGVGPTPAKQSMYGSPLKQDSTHAPPILASIAIQPVATPPAKEVSE
jgi:hypothetical protein